MSDRLTKLLDALRDGGFEPRQHGNRWSARCPAHNDASPSLSITQNENGSIGVKCFAGCKAQAIVSALALPLSLLGKGNKWGDPSKLHATTQPPPINLEEYARAKRLPVASLSSWGVANDKYAGAPCISIAYYSLDGAEVTKRYRIALSGEDKFRWAKGAKVVPYGLNRLRKARQSRRLILVEGESDCHTLWFHDYPALGLPGASTWKDEYADLLDGFEDIFLVFEPDKGGETLLESLGRSPVRDRVKVIELQGAKDVSELHLGGEAFKPLFDKAIDRARPMADLLAERAEAERMAALDVCRELAHERNILQRFEKEFSRLVAGEVRTAKVLFLACVSRILHHPVSVILKGPSSGGKSFTLESVLQFFPESAYFSRTGMSERSLIYSDEPLRHRMFVLYEAAGLNSEFAEYIIRSLLSEGRINYETVESTSNGMKPRVIEREGPTGLLMTTTRVSVHAENETRLISITVLDTREQTRRVLQMMSRSDQPKVDFEPWRALQIWLERGPNKVAIPFLEDVANLADVGAVRMRRDFGKIINLIFTHALLHQATREIRDGTIIATYEDYEAVRDLVADVIAEGIDSTVSDQMRETVEAVAKALGDGRDSVSAKEITETLGLDKSSVGRRLKAAIAKGYLVAPEGRKNGPLRVQLGDPLPSGKAALPTVAELRALRGCTVARISEGNPPDLALVPTSAQQVEVETLFL